MPKKEGHRVDTLKRAVQADLDALKRQVIVESYRSRGPGGQRRNKTETAIRLRHLPSGITVKASDFRLRSQNLKRAWERLRQRLLKREQPAGERVPTPVPRRAKEKRLEAKRRLAEKKRLRKPPFEEP
ncbi:MAG: peptide chain release factor-like protein [Desulfobacterota bacterium]|nr:peptide chain release factor-like protein [Thermodesulfobacteriota bacterium]